MSTGQLSSDLEARIKAIREQRAARRAARAAHPDLQRIATERREPLPLRLLKQVGLDVAALRDRHMDALERSRAVVKEFTSRPAQRPPRRRIADMPGVRLPPVPGAAPMGTGGTSVILQGPAVQVNCPPTYASCACDASANTFGVFMQYDGLPGCCQFAEAQPAGVTSDIWFTHTPDADGWMTYYPYVYLTGNVALQVTSHWYSPASGSVSLALTTSAHQGDASASSRTIAIDESGSDVHKAYSLDAELWNLGPTAIPVTAGVPVLIDVTADGFAAAYQGGNIALLDLCNDGQGYGIYVEFILGIWSPPVVIV